MVVAGDFNAGGVDWEARIVPPGAQQHSICEKVLDILVTHGLEQQQKLPTREGRVLDLFCTNKPGLMKSIHGLPGLSDHDIICTDCNIRARPVKKPPRKVHLWSRADWAQLKARAMEYKDKFMQQYLSRSVEENYNDFMSFVDSVMDVCVPTKKTSSRVNMPWFNNTLKRMCKKKHRLFNKAKRTNKPRHWEQYKLFKRDTLKAVRKHRWNYINDVLQLGLEQGDTKPFWRYVKAQRQDNVGVSPLLDNGVLHTDGRSKACILNKQFTSVFTREDVSNIPKMQGPQYPDIAELQICCKGVEKLLGNLNVSKASGPDLIPCRLLKGLAAELAPILTEIFKQSLCEGVIPSVWKNADVTPVFKKGGRDLAENYRPVSLTCVCCKIFEHIISSHIRQHLDHYSILSSFQHGFRKLHSCETQLLVTIQDLLFHRDKHIPVDMAILDFSKAFDTVPHRRLLGKLSMYGINGPILQWIEAFLTDRIQGVVVEGYRSEEGKVLSGVPQGTVLGPLLFLLHINDLPSVVDSQVRLFADDCLLYRPIRSDVDRVALQRDLDLLEQWSDTWGMRFNAKKCQIMSITRGRSHTTHLYTLCGHVLSSVQEAKYLGITLTDELSWSSHVHSVYSRANSTLGFLRRNLRRCPANLKETAYITLVRSTLEYAVAIWDPHLVKDCDMLEKVQRRSARFVKGDFRTTSSVTEMLHELGWKDLRDRRRNLRLTLLYKIVTGHVAVQPHQIGLVAADNRTRANHRFKFRALGASTSGLRNSFAVRTIGDWNQLPAVVVEQVTPASFKIQLDRLAPVTCRMP